MGSVAIVPSRLTKRHWSDGAEKVQTRISPETWALVEEKLQMDWSPEQISGWLKKEPVTVGQSLNGSTNTFMRTNELVELCTNICVARRNVENGMANMIAGAKSLPERALKSVQRSWNSENVSEIGKVDTIIGKGHQGAMVTLTERKSRFTLVRKVASNSADLVAQAMIDLLNWVAAS